MRTTSTFETTQITDLSHVLGQRYLVGQDSMLPFSELDELLPELLAVAAEGRHTVGGGHLSPDVLIAADRAQIRITETLGVSPFTIDISAIAQAVKSAGDCIYLANPNRVTGAQVGLNDLKELLALIPRGVLIVDEFYFEFFGITAVPLLRDHSNVVVLRSFAANGDAGVTDGGLVLASPTVIEHLTERLRRRIPADAKNRIMTLHSSDPEAFAPRLRRLHEEMLRVSTRLTRLGIQNRITAADFVLLRVADVTSTGNYLARYRVSFDNLDGYPLLKNYLRYQVRPDGDNDAILEAFSHMPLDYYRMAGVDSRAATLYSGAQEAPRPRVGARTSVRVKRSLQTPAH